MVDYSGLPKRDLDRKIKSMSRNWDGCGFGFGVRDHSFSFKSESAAEKFVCKVRQALGRKVRVSLDHLEEEE